MMKRKDLRRHVWVAFSAMLVVLVVHSDSLAQERPRKLRSANAAKALKEFNSSERSLIKKKNVKDKEVAKIFSEEHRKVRDELVAKLKTSLEQETKNGNLDKALEIRDAIKYFEKLDSPAGGQADVDTTKLAAENKKLLAKIGALEARLVAKGIAPPAGTTNSLGMQFRLIPAGKFQMGSETETEKLVTMFKGINPNFFANQLPQHAVRISKPFYMGSHEVTVGQFREFVKATQYVTEAESDPAGGDGYDGVGKTHRGKEFSWRKTGFKQDDNHPVVNVTWRDATEFCKWLSLKEKVEYRLPSEAQWEYACRAGTTSMYYNGNNPAALASIANTADTSLKAKIPTKRTDRVSDGVPFTNRVGQYTPNAFGLYDMYGNVGELCHDWFDASYYKQSPELDPQGPERGSHRVARGWGWGARALMFRSATRVGVPANFSTAATGFRVIRVSDPQVP